MTTATLTSKGQTVIPKSIRDALGLRPGDKLDFVVLDDHTILIKPTLQDVRKLKGMLRRAGRKAATIDDMKRAISKRGSRLP